MSLDFLAGMAASSRQRVAAAREQCSDVELWRRAEAAPQPPRLVLSPQGFDVIAEVKLRSPAVGVLRGGDENVTARVTSYAAAGAAAVSVLTEPERFEGSLEHLEEAARALKAAGSVPAMRKDFLVDPYQVAEARLAGAGGILIIVRMLARAELDALIKEMVGLLPASVPRVAESGVATAEDAARLVRAGYDMALIGSALMTTEDPAALLSAMLAAGRGAR
jgi:indole-3-glycerol phosphate synthase